MRCTMPLEKERSRRRLLRHVVCCRRGSMIDLDDFRFASFTRDLARRHRRPRSYPPPPPVRADALEQLCGGGVIALPDLLALEPFADELVALEREDDPS
ncbi:MAG: hypothetical protein BGO98_39425 [Myxococcales bacterium 68-20]|nr:MAG: hypothetical protein BGO98_39425 [Myxococcales bacterium 68-20]